MHVNKCGGVGYSNLKLIKGMYVKGCANCPFSSVPRATKQNFVVQTQNGNNLLMSLQDPSAVFRQSESGRPLCICFNCLLMQIPKQTNTWKQLSAWWHDKDKVLKFKSSIRIGKKI